MTYNMRKRVLKGSRLPMVIGEIEIDRETVLKLSHLEAEFDEDARLQYIQLFLPAAIAPCMTIGRDDLAAIEKRLAAAPEALPKHRSEENSAPAFDF